MKGVYGCVCIFLVVVVCVYVCMCTLFQLRPFLGGFWDKSSNN